MTYSLKPLYPWVSNFTCSITRLQGFRRMKFSVCENRNLPLLLKVAKPLKSTFPPESLDIYWLKFCVKHKLDFDLQNLEWPGGAMVLDRLPVPGRPTYLDKSRARACCSCSRCGWGLFGYFSLVYHFTFLSPSLLETAQYRLKYCLKGPLRTKQPTNQFSDLSK